METKSANAIFSIMPYKWNGLWVFDDPAVNLRREAFIAGTDEILDLLTAAIPGADRGFICQFSATPFPGANVTLRHVRTERMAGRETGNYYFCEQTQTEGWLCPALFCYFTSAPKTIYARFSSARKENRQPKPQPKKTNE